MVPTIHCLRCAGHVWLAEGGIKKRKVVSGQGHTMAAKSIPSPPEAVGAAFGRAAVGIGGLPGTFGAGLTAKGGAGLGLLATGGGGLLARELFGLEFPGESS